MEELKSKANKHFTLGEYGEAVAIYTQILKNDTTNYSIILNRAVVYIKMGNYQEGLEDAVKATKMNLSSAKAWGRVGAALYGLNRLENALIAYNKANELEPNIIYQNMIKDIQKTLTQINEIKNYGFNKCEFTRDQTSMVGNKKGGEMQVEEMLTNMMGTVLSNPKMMETLNNTAFQSKLISLGENPLNAFKDGDVIGFVNDLMHVMKRN